MPIILRTVQSKASSDKSGGQKYQRGDSSRLRFTELCWNFYAPTYLQDTKLVEIRHYEWPRLFIMEILHYKRRNSPVVRMGNRLRKPFQCNLREHIVG